MTDLLADPGVSTEVTTPDADGRVVAVLRAAREYLSDPSMWGQHVLGIFSAPSCAYGAIAGRSHGEVLLAARYALASVVCPDHVGSRAVGIGDWNDAPERTHAEVLAAFDAAIEAASAPVSLTARGVPMGGAA